MAGSANFQGISGQFGSLITVDGMGRNFLFVVPATRHRFVGFVGWYVPVDKFILSFVSRIPVLLDEYIQQDGGYENDECKQS